MSEFPEVEVIARLLSLSERYGLDELEAEEAGLRVTVRAPQLFSGEETEATGTRNGSGSLALWPPVWAQPAEAPAGPTRPATALPLPAPLTGSFYRAETPESVPYAEIGQTVEKGDVVGLIEAMKVFSKVEAEHDGVVVEITVPNGKVVQHGEVLMWIDPGAAT